MQGLRRWKHAVVHRPVGVLDGAREPHPVIPGLKEATEVIFKIQQCNTAINDQLFLSIFEFCTRWEQYSITYA